MHFDVAIYVSPKSSPLGPLFTNFYMTELENILVQDSSTGKLVLFYGRYVDDVIVLAKSENNIEELRRVIEQNSSLKFTYKINCHKLSFLDVDVTIDNGK